MKSIKFVQNIHKYGHNQLHRELHDLWNQINTKQSRNKKIKIQNQNNRTRESIQSSPNKKLHCKECNIELRKCQEQIEQANQKLNNALIRNKKMERQIENLKQTIRQLLIDKQKLIQQIQNLIQIIQVNKGSEDKQKLQQFQYKNYREKLSTDQITQDSNSLQTNIQRLLSLLRSTDQYRQFSYYYQNNQLSFLKNLTERKKRNCCHNYSQEEKVFWCHKSVLNILNQMNIQNKLELNPTIIQQTAQKLEIAYKEYENSKVQKLKQLYSNRIKQIQRTKNYNIPYEIVQIQRLKERQLSKLNNKIRFNKKNEDQC